jgi:hypothetical protein
MLVLVLHAATGTSPLPHDVRRQAKDSRTQNLFSRRILPPPPVVLFSIGAHVARLVRRDTMQRVTLVRYATKPDRSAENEALSRAVFTELRAQAPKDMAYALFKGSDGVTFVHLFVNLAADDADALTELPAFKTYQTEITDRCETKPEVVRLGLDLLDAYGFAPAQAAKTDRFR